MRKDRRDQDLPWGLKERALAPVTASRPRHSSFPGGTQGWAEEQVYEYGGSGRWKVDASLCVFNVGAGG